MLIDMNKQSVLYCCKRFHNEEAPTGEMSGLYVIKCLCQLMSFYLHDLDNVNKIVTAKQHYFMLILQNNSNCCNGCQWMPL